MLYSGYKKNYNNIKEKVLIFTTKRISTYVDFMHIRYTY